MLLTQGQRSALNNLARKQSGQEVGWISIVHARALTDMGLAERTRAGWMITSAGLQALTPDPDDEAAANDPVPLRP